MIDAFDYKEPSCALCGGKEFYNPSASKADGRIPIQRIIQKLDELFNKNSYEEAGRLLEYWLGEAINLNDEFGELTLQNELIGYYRKTFQQEKGLKAIERSTFLLEKLGQLEMPSGATILLNCATAYKAFGKAEKGLELFALAEKIYDKLLEKNDERFGGLYNNTALALVDIKDYNGALKKYNLAVKVMKAVKHGKPDLAITYVNMAHVYYELGDKKMVTECMYNASELLFNEENVQNGYFAYVCEKCSPSFEFFGYDIISKQLKQLSKEIYERA